MKKVIWLCVLLFVISGCDTADAVDLDQPLTSDDPPLPTEALPVGEYETGEEVAVESIETIFLESFPLQVHAIVKGNLPDGCTTIRETQGERDGDVFYIRIYTQRPVDAICTQALVPFEESIPLDVYGLPAGAYAVRAYGLETEFVFTQDNILQGNG